MAAWLVPLFCCSLTLAFGYWLGRSDSGPKSAKCGDGNCSSRSDPRCAAGNCTYHCQAGIGCNRTCIKVWERCDKAEELAREALRKARAE